MEVHEMWYNPKIVEQKEKVAAALIRLKELRSKTGEIRAKCESLREIQATNKVEIMVCSECHKGIQQNQEITVMDYSGNPVSHYHKDCVRAIWASENWKFDFSSPGFLRKSEKSR
jgi:hypothetical protein